MGLEHRREFSLEKGMFRGEIKKRQKYYIQVYLHSKVCQSEAIYFLKTKKYGSGSKNGS